MLQFNLICLRSLLLPAMALASMLRLLGSNSLLTCSLNEGTCGGPAERRYRLAAPGKFFVKNERGPSLGMLQQLGNHQLETMAVCYNLKDAVLGGVDLYDRFYGHPFYDLAKDPEYRKLFQGAMTSHSVFVFEKVLKIYHGFDGLDSLVNVAGGHGTALEWIISKYPSIRGINFDLPQIVQSAPAYPGIGIDHIGGDMFIEVPKGDAMIMKYILHNWKDEQCIQLLTNCYKALPDNKLGKLIALECILPELPRVDHHSKFASQMDVMMSMLLGAKQRTKYQFQRFAKEAGFQEFKLVCYVNGVWLMEFIKNPNS